MLMQCIDSLVLKVQSGVVINFEKIGPDPPPIENNGPGREDGLDDPLMGNGAPLDIDNKDIYGDVINCDGEKNGVSVF